MKWWNMWNPCPEPAGYNTAGSNQPRAGPVRKDRAYVTLALPLEKVLAQSWK